jgi:hypothetical protein
MKFTCAVCKLEHDGLPDIAFRSPYYYDVLPEAGRGPRVFLDSDFCQVDDDYFIRGCLELPIIGRDEVFSYGVWISVSETNFGHYRETFHMEDPPPARYLGWLSNQLPGYPDTLRLKAAAHVRPHNQRPYIELEPTDHPLAVRQRDGIAIEEVIKACSDVLHSPDS